VFRNAKSRQVIPEDPEETRKKILGDPFLKYLYTHLYSNLISVGLGQTIESFVNRNYFDVNHSLNILEIGSAGGILKDLFPSIVTSDVRICEGVDVVINAQALPVSNDSLDLLIGKDVLHHLPNVSLHFDEISRVLRKGSSAAYLEPNWNFFSKIIYKYLHPEPWREDVESWSFSSNGPMDSNQALAKIIFTRDSDLFSSLYPNLKVEIVETPLNSIAFLLSGGVHMRNRISSQLLTKLYIFESTRKHLLKFSGLNRVIKITKI
jgi:SAM-dependent methyltransferase